MSEEPVKLPAKIKVSLKIKPQSKAKEIDDTSIVTTNTEVSYIGKTIEETYQDKTLKSHILSAMDDKFDKDIYSIMGTNTSTLSEEPEISFFISITASTMEQIKFKKSDVINLGVKKRFNLQTTKSDGKQRVKISYLYIENNIIKKSTSILNVKSSDPEDINQAANNWIDDFTATYENRRLIKDNISLLASEVEKIPNAILERLYYIVPDAKAYKSQEELPIDPYYLGFWLGDGTSAEPTQFVCGGEPGAPGGDDQKYILPYMNKFAEELGLGVHKANFSNEAANIRFTINNSDYASKHVTHKCELRDIYQDDWVDVVYDACLKLSKSKAGSTGRAAFLNSYDPYKDYKLNDNYTCQVCGYTTTNVNSPKDGPIIEKTKQYRFSDHLKKAAHGRPSRPNVALHKPKEHNLILSQIIVGAQAWKLLSAEEQAKWKQCDNKKDIIQKCKYVNNKSLWNYHKIFESDGKDGLIQYKKEQLDSTNKIMLEFIKLNLVNNKHIPEIYMTASVEDRKKLLAGLIDSDGTSGGKSKKNQYWDIQQKRIELVKQIDVLCKSLGMRTRISTKYGYASYKDGSRSETRPYERIIIHPYNNWDIPLLLERKKIVSRPSSYLNIRHLVKI